MNCNLLIIITVSVLYLSLCLNVCLALAPKDVQMILFKLTAIEEQQKHQTRMLQSLMNSSNGGGDDWKLPEDVSLPLNSLESLNQLEEVLKQKEN